jgi:hypothetical protein
MTDPTGQPYPQWPVVTPQPLPPRRPARVWKIVAIVTGALFALCVGLVVLGLIVGPQPTKTADHPAAPAPVATTSPALVATSAAPATSAAVPPPATSRPAAPPPATTTQAPAAPPSAELCKVTGGGATYYRWVTSATDHNFTACQGATVVPGTVDDLLKQDNMDRRCILGDEATARYDAIVGVYSDTNAKNLAAARAWCKANGGQLDG